MTKYRITLDVDVNDELWGNHGLCRKWFETEVLHDLRLFWADEDFIFQKTKTVKVKRLRG
jgi:hypothetical protein